MFERKAFGEFSDSELFPDRPDVPDLYDNVEELANAIGMVEDDTTDVKTYVDGILKDLRVLREVFTGHDYLWAADPNRFGNVKRALSDDIQILSPRVDRLRASMSELMTILDQMRFMSLT